MLFCLKYTANILNIHGQGIPNRHSKQEKKMEDVSIKVYDKQIYEEHEDVNETEFRGQLVFRNEGIYITFKDEKIKVTTIIKAKNGVVSVKRLGALKGNLEFSTHNSHLSIYTTPYGEMEINIVTEKCEIEVLEKGIKIYIEYKLLMQEELISHNIYKIVAN